MAGIIHPAAHKRRRTTRFWLVLIAALFATVATASLGRWQLSRAAQKQALHDAIETRRNLPPLRNTDLLAQRDQPVALLHRPVALRGRFVPEYTIYLDNRQMRGRPGFYVLTPLLLEHSNDAVLIQRGWIPRNFLDRIALPDLATPTGVVQLSGRIAPVPAKLFEFEDAARGRIRQNLDLADYRDETRLALIAISVLQTAQEEGVTESSGAADAKTRDVSTSPASALRDGSPPLLREWPELGSGVDTHYGYAAQWFALSLLIVCLYVWHQLVKPRRMRTSASATID